MGILTVEDNVTPSPDRNARDRAAVDRLLRGDIGGLEHLVRTYQAKAVRLAYGILDDRSRAEDIVQSAFLRTYERIDQFDRNRPFEPWFLRIVFNDAVKTARKGGKLMSLELMAEVEDAPWQSLVQQLGQSWDGDLENLEDADLRVALRKALQRLSPKDRAFIVGHYYGGLSVADLAEQRDAAEGTVKWRLHEARNRLRRLMGGSY